MKKNSVIVLVAGLLLIAILLITIMFMYIYSKPIPFVNTDNDNLLAENKYDTTSVSNISLNVQSTDVFIEEGKTDKIEIKTYGRKNEKYDIKLNDGNLSIVKDINKSFCIGICYGQEKVLISVPKGYNKKTNIKTTSGDIKIDTNLDGKLSINTTSGDIEIAEVLDGNIKTTSGDIEIKKISNMNISTTSGDVDIKKCNNINIKSVSGDIEIESANLDENGLIETISGDVKILETNSIYIDYKTVSGDSSIKDNNRHAYLELKIETVSGNLEVG